ncbi:unnamed protein product [Cyprideis torosa]|uniref:Uncharacterized protein n=1 Tax=Cyprideis torosa TaxID=163714 RepID=A0A7R8ZQW3_9CRUS|nr:unnamed protein product [Cyprideis torosa]CAG0903867.1 unnamed protein product [Cyprideis torosa]
MKKRRHRRQLQDIRQMFRSEGPTPSRLGLLSLKHYRTQLRKDVYDDPGILVSEDAEWYNLRSRVQQVMMKPSSATAYFEAISDVSDTFVERIETVLLDNKRETPEDFQFELYKWALESISLVALDTRLGILDSSYQPGSEPDQMIKATNDMFECMGYLEMAPFKQWGVFPRKRFRRFQEAADTFTTVGQKYLREAEERVKRKLALYDDGQTHQELTVLETMLTNPDLTPGNVLVMALDMLMAGIDTTSHSMAFILYNLCKNPEVQEKAFQEVKSVLPTPSSKLSPSIVNSDIPYVKAVIKESMRLSPITSGTIRTLPQDTVIHGYRIPKGTQVFGFTFATRMNPKFFPEPEKFLPERFMRSGPKELAPTAFSYLPFGHGHRMCIGRRFAELEMWILLTKLLRKYRFEWHYGNLGMCTRLVNIPDQPLRFRLIPR